jgi:hypothetical protein
MAKETVTIGCKLPAGLKLEVGYTIEKLGGGQGRMVKSAGYQAYIIRGWNHHSIEMRRQLEKAGSTGGVPHGMNTQPFLNRGVPKDIWEEWKKMHPGSWLLKNEILFEVASSDHAGAALRVVEGDKTPKIFEPLNPKETIVPGVKPLEREDI